MIKCALNRNNLFVNGLFAVCVRVIAKILDSVVFTKGF